MKARDIVVGEAYIVKVSGRLVPVRVLGEFEAYTRPHRRWRCRNLRTNREIIVKSTQRFRFKASDTMVAAARGGAR